MIIFYVFGLIGIFLLMLGLFVKFSRSNRAKTWYAMRGVPFIAPNAIKYIPIPLGVMAIVIAVAPFIDGFYISQIYLCSIFPIVIANILLAIWTPSWLMPSWINWLFDTYGQDFAHAMLFTVEKPHKWAERISTQEGLEAWAEETYQQIKAEQEVSGRR